MGMLLLFAGSHKPKYWTSYQPKSYYHSSCRGTMIVCTRFMLIHPIFETFHPTPQMWTSCWLWRKSKWIPERFIVWESRMSVQNFMAVVVGERRNDRPANQQADRPTDQHCHPLELACLDPQDNILSVEEKQIRLMAQWIQYQRLLLVYMYESQKYVLCEEIIYFYPQPTWGPLCRLCCRFVSPPLVPARHARRLHVGPADRRGKLIFNRLPIRVYKVNITSVFITSPSSPPYDAAVESAGCNENMGLPCQALGGA